MATGAAHPTRRWCLPAAVGRGRSVGPTRRAGPIRRGTCTRSRARLIAECGERSGLRARPAAIERCATASVLVTQRRAVIRRGAHRSGTRCSVNELARKVKTEAPNFGRPAAPIASRAQTAARAGFSGAGRWTVRRLTMLATSCGHVERHGSLGGRRARFRGGRIREDQRALSWPSDVSVNLTQRLRRLDACF